jgi:hypothetical protein
VSAVAAYPPTYRLSTNYVSGPGGGTDEVYDVTFEYCENLIGTSGKDIKANAVHTG